MPPAVVVSVCIISDLQGIRVEADTLELRVMCDAGDVGDVNELVVHLRGVVAARALFVRRYDGAVSTTAPVGKYTPC